MKRALMMLAVAAALCVAGQASADPILVGSDGNDGLTWDYTAIMNGNSQIDAGDFIVIYDFGVVASETNTLLTGAGGMWVFSQQLSGPCPAGTMCAGANDDPNILNAVYTYVGANPYDPGPGGIHPVGSFHLTKAGAPSANDPNGRYGAQDSSDTPPHQDLPAIDAADVPLAPSTPEPSMLLLLGSGLLGFSGINRLRSKK